MTGNAFLKRLTFQLDFLSEDDRKVVISFYERKLKEAAGLTDEEAIVKSFGSPEHIATALKNTMMAHSAKTAAQANETNEEDAMDHAEPTDDRETATAEEENAISTDNGELLEDSAEVQDKIRTDAIEAITEEGDADTEDTIDPNEKAENEKKEDSEVSEDSEESDESKESESKDNEDADEDEDLIFSKPAVPLKASEIIQSMENNESKPLFGEKVVVDPADLSLGDTIEIDPGDLENGLTPEEIKSAKAETLEKAQNYNTATFGIPKLTESDASLNDGDETSEDEATDPAKDESDFDAQEAKSEHSSEKVQAIEEEGENDPPSQKAGLFRRMFSRSSDSVRRVFTVILSVLFSPLLLLLFSFGPITYGVCVLFLAILAAALFLVMALCVVLGVIELIYGFMTLFDSVFIAMVELGLGIVLFSAVTAISALIYECLFALLPKAFRNLTTWCKKYLVFVSEFFYGGAA